MPGLLIIAHAPLASSLKAVAEHAFPECAARLGALDVLSGMPIEEVEAQGRQLLDRLRSPDAAVARAVAGATQGVMQVATSRPQNQTRKAGGNDQGNSQDQ